MEEMSSHLTSAISPFYEMEMEETSQDPQDNMDCYHSHSLSADGT